MRRISLFFFVTILSGLVAVGCDSAGDGDGTAVFTGRVIDQEGVPVPGAVVAAKPNADTKDSEEVRTQTDREGEYSISVDVTKETDLRLVVSKEGYRSAELTVPAFAGETREVVPMQIASTGEVEPPSGEPSNIKLLSQSDERIMVKESGGREVANLTFQVADSTGRPVTLDNQLPVRFSIAQGPGGGEFIGPKEATTDNNGKVTANLSSGTKAGVVQVLVEARLEDRTIRSKPVSVTIHGGFPHQDRFTLAPTTFNVPGRKVSGLESEIGVIVGDRYGNPARPNTAVYFTTSGGVIEGSTLTDEQGRGSANLITGRPLPEDGIALIKASTLDEDSETVESEVAVVFSGAPQLQIDDTRLGLGREYHLTLTDDRGNPLAPGTVLSVAAEGKDVKAVGNANVTLDDTVFKNGGLTYDDVRRGEGITSFSFRPVEGDNEEERPVLEAVRVTVSGPNGSASLVLTPSGASTSAAPGARLETLPGGGVRVTAAP